MRAQELMVGDIVNALAIKKQKVACRVVSATNVNNTVEVTIINESNKYCGLICRPYEIYPIPLTPEIFINNGFEEKSWEGVVADKLNIKVGYVKDNIKILSDLVQIDTRNERLPILPLRFIGYAKYVHELQHILRVVGLNELADNFKI